jgi:hypothetical protein
MPSGASAPQGPSAGLPATMVSSPI